MSVREFDGSDDFILFSLGAVPVFTFGSMWAVVWMSDFSTAGNKHFIAFGLAASGNSYTFGLEATSGVLRVVNQGSTTRVGTTALTDGRWHIIGMSKATGAATPRFHIWDNVGQTWVHENASGTQANNGETHTGIALGATFLGASPFAGRIAAAAVLQGTALSDGDFETLHLGVARWFAHGPQAVWQLTQDATSQTIVDLTGGGANESALTGTAVNADMSPIPLVVPSKFHHLMRVA